CAARQARRSSRQSARARCAALASRLSTSARGQRSPCMSTLPSFGNFAPPIGRDIDIELALAREAGVRLDDDVGKHPRTPETSAYPVERALPASPVAVQLEQVSKRYGARRVLDAFDFTIERGSFVAIVGRSGCGKSTLL